MRIGDSTAPPHPVSESGLVATASSTPSPITHGSSSADGRETVTRVEAWCCALQMPYPLHLGAITYRTRDYVVLRVTTSTGTQGTAVGYTRGTPLMAALNSLAGDLFDFEDISPTSVHRTLRRRYAPGWAALVRAASLIDIALWDIASRTAGFSLGAYLGGSDRDIPLMAVAGYFLDQRGPARVLEEVNEFVEAGYDAVKLIVPGHELQKDLRLVESVASILPRDVALGIDFHGAFPDLDYAAAYADAFNNQGLAFIEDPFPSYDSDLVTALAQQTSTSIAAGEDVTSGYAYDTLVRGGVEVIRADVTASGGYSEVLTAINRIPMGAATVAPHVWPHAHQPLAQAQLNVRAVEVIPHTTGADPIDLILTAPFPIEDGRWRAPSEPGLWLPVDWDRVRAAATEKVDVSAGSRLNRRHDRKDHS